MLWTLSRDEIITWEDAPVEELLDAASLPLRLPLTQSSTPLNLFSALAVETCSCEVASGPADDAPVSHDFAVDSVFYAGGPVWAMDWCPLHGTDADKGPVSTTETLAVSTHPKSQRRNPVGLQHAGPGVVQLLGVPSSMDSQLIPGGLPQLLALLWHEGRLAWDVQWCPNPAAFISISINSVGSSSSSSSSDDGSDDDDAAAAAAAAAVSNVPLQGLLAAVLGSGDVVVWAVPTIKFLIDLGGGDAQQQQQQQDMQLDQQQDSQNEQQVVVSLCGQALSLQLAPIMQLPASTVGGSLASCCRWLPTAPHDQLLVGYWDGNVAIWKLPTAAGGAAEPIHMLRADPTPITAVSWQPSKRWWLTGSTPAEPAAAAAQESSSSSSSSSSQYFVTASSIGNLKVWDKQDVMAPCQERLFTRNTITACEWLGPPHVIVTASADGLLRQVWLDAGVQATTVSQTAADVSGSCGSVWSLSACEPLAVAAYVADGGLLGLMPLEPVTGDNRHRKSHAAVSAVAVAEEQLWLLSAREIPGNGGLYTNYTGWKEGGYKARSGDGAPPTTTVVLDPLPHPDQVLYAVKFSPNYRGVAMLAYGGGAGVVRLHRLSADVVPVGM